MLGADADKHGGGGGGGGDAKGDRDGDRDSLVVQRRGVKVMLGSHIVELDADGDILEGDEHGGGNKNDDDSDHDSRTLLDADGGDDAAGEAAVGAALLDSSPA